LLQNHLRSLNLAESALDSRQAIVDSIRAAGVVGAGGAGFPTHVKAAARADTVIANGCECEPLLATDAFVLRDRVGEMLAGLRMMMLATGAGRGLVGVRKSAVRSLPELREEIESDSSFDLVTVADTYPAGDEHVLVYEATGRVVPQGGLPTDVRVVVSNVNTLVNVARSANGIPVTDRVISVCGDLPGPCVVEAPVGTTIGDLLRLTGNDAGLMGKKVLLSGIMMGRLEEDLDSPLDKRTSAVVALPEDNELVVRKSLPVSTMVRRAASVCCQCRLCTDLCPRHLMGHAIEPHRIMRAVAWNRAFAPDMAGALFCSGCGLCGAYACPMLLSPDRISFMVRSELQGRRVAPEQSEPAGGVEPVRSGRLVPHERIVERTGVAPYRQPLEFRGRVEPERVSIPLFQHIGGASEPVVKPGEEVRRGQLVGEIPPDSLSARVHASIDGRVVKIDENVVIESR
jgi:Na+-translocating ferredoxin:NAD+ oxidoreductase RnfC subunit